MKPHTYIQQEHIHELCHYLSTFGSELVCGLVGPSCGHFGISISISVVSVGSEFGIMLANVTLMWLGMFVRSVWNDRIWTIEEW